MRPCLPLLAFLVAAAALPAQTAPSPQSTVLPVMDKANCPVQFHAQRWNDASSLRDVDTQRPGTASRGLYLHSQLNLSSKDVRWATVVVRGSAPSPHLTPARAAAAGNLQQTFHLADLPRDRDGSWKLVTDQVPLIQQIEITEVHFVDGSVWLASEDAHCRFAPDAYLPVASLR